jgi:hypothetical protein
MLSSYNDQVGQVLGGQGIQQPRPASAVESASASAVEAQYKLTDLLHELQRRLEPALASSYPVAGSAAETKAPEPASQLVASYKHAEAQTNIHLAIVGDILSRLTL